jgi:hypothetical protein
MVRWARSAPPSLWFTLLWDYLLGDWLTVRPANGFYPPEYFSGASRPQRPAWREISGSFFFSVSVWV